MLKANADGTFSTAHDLIRARIGKVKAMFAQSSVNASHGGEVRPTSRT